MLRIKVSGGTPRAGKGLCHTCKYANVVRGQNCEEFIRCEPVFAGPVPFRVAECGTYHPVNMPWLHEMKDIAWRIEARPRGPKGFEPDRADMEVVVSPPKKELDIL